LAGGSPVRLTPVLVMFSGAGPTRPGAATTTAHPFRTASPWTGSKNKTSTPQPITYCDFSFRSRHHHPRRLFARAPLLCGLKQLGREWEECPKVAAICALRVLLCGPGPRTTRNPKLLLILARRSFSSVENGHPEAARTGKQEKHAPRSFPPLSAVLPWVTDRVSLRIYRSCAARPNGTFRPGRTGPFPSASPFFPTRNRPHSLLWLYGQKG